jgi:hypothetical protein
MIIWTEAGWKHIGYVGVVVPAHDVRDVPQGEAVPY